MNQTVYKWFKSSVQVWSEPLPIPKCDKNVPSKDIFICRRLVEHLDEVGFSVSLVITEWFLCLFAKSLPSEVLPFLNTKYCVLIDQLIVE